MLVGLDVKQAAAALGVRPATVLKHIRKHQLKASKTGSKWQVYLPGRGCSLCEAGGAVSILIRCATCERYYCAFCSFSVCNDGQHGQTRKTAVA